MSIKQELEDARENNSAHPGLAPIKGANLYSFYSDISEIVLKNDKFALAGGTA